MPSRCIAGEWKNGIDLLTGIDAVLFEEAWADRIACVVDGVAFPMISRHQLAMNKPATGRAQDLADVARLEGE